MDYRIYWIIEEEVAKVSPNIDMEKLLSNIKAQIKKLEQIDNLMRAYKEQFNEFKRPIDRKYALYDYFGILKPIYGYKVTKYVGSNQVILEKDGKVIYDSDREGKLSNPLDFEVFFETQIFLIRMKEI